MKRFALAILSVFILGGLAHAGPYILCYRIIPSGQMNFKGQSIKCCEIVKVTEWQREGFYGEEYKGQKLCPKGTFQKVYRFQADVAKDLDLCPNSR